MSCRKEENHLIVAPWVLGGCVAWYVEHTAFWCRLAIMSPGAKIERTWLTDSINKHCLLVYLWQTNLPKSSTHMGPSGKSEVFALQLADHIFFLIFTLSLNRPTVCLFICAIFLCFYKTSNYSHLQKFNQLIAKIFPRGQFRIDIGLRFGIFSLKQ